MFYQHLQQQFKSLIQQHNLAQETVDINARILSNEEAIGLPSRDDYPLLKGKEFLMEARCLDQIGQAYTDAPSHLSTTLADISQSDLTTTSQCALFIATLNAVVRATQPETKTVHCHNDEPELCAKKIIKVIALLEPKKITLIGLQPAILEALVKQWGAENIQCLDRDQSMIGQKKYGVSILWGDGAETSSAFKQSDLILATGSTIVNGYLPQLLALTDSHQKPIFFYGTSIAGTAKLMGLNHLCFEAS